MQQSASKAVWGEALSGFMFMPPSIEGEDFLFCYGRTCPDLNNTELECRLWAGPYHVTSVADLTNALDAKWEQILVA